MLIRDDSFLGSETVEGSITLPSESFPNVPNETGADFMRMPTIERSDHSVAAERIDEIGLSLVISERRKYRQKEDGSLDAIEPIRMSVSMVESFMGAWHGR